MSAAPSQPDYSKIDPAWAAKQMDESLRSGEMGSTWAAVKSVFPEDYARLMREISDAALQHRDWTAVAPPFLQAHLVGGASDARRAPAEVQAQYERQKTSFLAYLSRNNIPACAYLSSGKGDASVLNRLGHDGMTRYSSLLAAMVQAIGSGRKSPTNYDPLSQDDVSKLVMIMKSQGASEAEVQQVVSGKSAPPPPNGVGPA